MLKLHGLFYTTTPEEARAFLRDKLGLSAYDSGGGWLMRYTWFGMSLSGPMLFNGNGCGFVLRDRIFKAAQISEVN